MCSMCEGATADEVLDVIEDHIQRVGWACVPVIGESQRRSWTYTIGLSQTWDVPELVMVGACDHCAHMQMTDLIERRVATEWGRGSPAETSARGHRLGVAPVHPSQWHAGRFAAWLGHRRRHPHDAPNRAVQLLFADDEGLLPTEPGVDPGVKRAQTRLDRAVVPHRTPPRGQGRRPRR